MKKSVKKALVAVNERVQFMRKSEDHMKVRNIDDFGSALIDPNLL